VGSGNILIGQLPVTLGNNPDFPVAVQSI
jgi:hypothetical protein